MGLSALRGDDHWKDQPRDEGGMWSETGASGGGIKALKNFGQPKAEAHAPPEQTGDDIDALFGVEKDELQSHPDMQAWFGDKAPSQEQLNANYGMKGSQYQNDVKVVPGQFGIDISANIVDKATGEPVTYKFERSIIQGDDGTLTVKHYHLATNPAFPNAGREILHNTTKEHYAMGVRRIAVEPQGGGQGHDYDTWQAKTAEFKAARAALDVATKQHKAGQMDPATFKSHMDAFKARTSEGGDLHSGYIGPYVWAASGFKWSSGDAEFVGDSFASYLTKEHGVPEHEARAHADRVKHEPKKMLGAKVNGKSVGAHFMQQRLSNTMEPWSLDMKKGEPSWEHYKTVYGLGGIDADQDVDAGW